MHGPQQRDPRVPAQPPGPAAFRACAARKSPSSPESASTTTSAWIEAAPRASPKPSWTPSPAPCTWNTELAQPTTTARARRKRPLAPQRVRPALYRALDALTVPAVVQGRPLDVLAANPPGYALFADFASRPHCDRNFARFVFLGKAALSLYTDWERVAGDTVTGLRLYAGRHSDDPQLTEVIGELSLHSDTFRRLGADQDVRAHTTGTKRLHHPLVGDLTLDYVVLAAEDDPEQSLAIYAPEPSSPSAEALGILASWTSTSTTPAPASE
ncbi:hypothetical protein [Streptomyces sp. A1136]|uniref:MmyB family transcriptional regulator n=1 Tax=Streptomyces sp. A1136 TaxID=2563102 RepID=UPI0026D5C27D